MRKLLIGLIAAAAWVVATPETVNASGWGGGCNGGGCGKGGLCLFCRAPQRLAPWYLYWPYWAHFQTPAPMGGAWYGPPGYGGGYGGGFGGYGAQPYFPGAPTNSYPFTGSPAPYHGQ